MPRRGHTVAAAGALLLLAACVTAPAEEARPVCPPSRAWHAWIDILPGPGEHLGLFVAGEVDIPAGMAAKVRPGPLDRMMPPGQRFTLELARGKGIWGRQVVTGRVRAAHSVFREVIVSCGGSEVARISGDAIETAD